MRNALLIILFLISFIVLGIFLEQSSYFCPIKKELQKITLPSPPLKFSKRGTILEKLGLTYVFPRDYSNFFDSKTGKFKSGNIISLDSPRPEYGKDWGSHEQILPEKIPSSLIMDQSIISKGIPILSVVVDENDLYDPSTGIFTNRKRKGKAWERPCFISYYDKGKLLFATGAGIRIHGSSLHKRKAESLRFYFRAIYGCDQFKPGIIFDRESEPLRQVIARIEFNFASALALDLSKRIGCIVPQEHPVEVYLNGSRYGDRYVLIEHLNKEWLVSHYGHDNFVLLRTTGHREERRKSNEYQRLIKWANDKNIRMTMEEVGKYVDIDNLSRWFISQFYTAGNDMYQGPLLLDKSKPDSKWFWINWDMDCSFKNPFEPEKKNMWEQELNIYNVMHNPKRDRKNPKTARFQRKDPRAILFRRLRNEDPEFKKYFERLFMNVMNHRLTPDILRSWVDYHEKIILSLGSSDQEFFNQLRLFVNHRSEYLRKLMQKYFGSPESHICRVGGPADMTYEIDGFRSAAGYKGWYFKGSEITVKIESKNEKAVSYWMVNGEKIKSDDNQLKYTINSKTTIEPVFTSS